jgi:hypothetical protein
MLVNDLHHNSKAEIALVAQTVTTGTVDGAIIDTADFEALEFLLQSGTLTDGAFAVTLVHGDDSGLSDVTDVSAEEMLGDASFAVTDDDTAKRVGYTGKKRYVRLKIVATGASSGGPMSGMAILAFGKHQPVAD